MDGLLQMYLLHFVAYKRQVIESSSAPSEASMAYNAALSSSLSKES